MKIGKLLAQTRESISFEFFPPKTREDEERLFEVIRKLESFHPDFVSVTYGAGGGTRTNTRDLVERIKRETSLTAMPHLTLINQGRDELTDILRDYQDLGIENLLALRGDPPKGTTEFVPRDGLVYASDLVQLAASFRAFSIGVAVYPEGHLEAPSREADLMYAKRKIDAGADFAIAQMFFDNRFFYDFLERAERIGIRVPIIPGIMPIENIEKTSGFCKLCGTTIPARVRDRIERASSPQGARQIGIELATEQCADLWSNGVRYFHFYTLNRAEAVSEILGNLGWARGKRERPAVPAQHSRR